DERTVGEVAVLRVVIRLLDVVDGRSDRDGALELRAIPREGGEAGGLLQGEVRLTRRSFDLEAFDAANEIRRKIGSFQELQEGPLRIRSGSDHLRLDPFTRCQFDAHRAAVLNQDPSYVGVHATVDDERPG